MNKKSKKAHNGDGSFRLYQTKKGKKYEFTFSYKALNGDKKKKTVTGISKPDCYAKRDEFLRKELANIEENLKHLTVLDLYRYARKERYADGECNDEGDARNESTAKILEKLPLSKPIGLIPIRDVSIQDVANFRSTIINNYSQSCIDKAYCAIKTAFEIAYDMKIIDTNIINKNRKFKKSPNSKIATKVVEAFNAEQEKEFFKIIDAKAKRKGCKDYSIQLHISALTGMRMGEINALRRDSIDLKNKTIRIDKTISRGKNYEVHLKNGTKTKKSNRIIPINDKVLPYIELALNNYKQNPYNLLFYNHKDKQLIRTEQVTDWAKAECKKFGFEFQGSHVLRHTYATKCVRGGMNIVILAAILGHDDIKITNKYYLSISIDDKKNAINDVINAL